MDDYLFYEIMGTLGAILSYLIIKAIVRAPGTSLQLKFSRLGVLKGKTLSEIKKKCGPPNSVSPMGDGTTLYQWIETGYHIALLFDRNDICLGVSSETSV